MAKATKFILPNHVAFDSILVFFPFSLHRFIVVKAIDILHKSIYIVQTLNNILDLQQYAVGFSLCLFWAKRLNTHFRVTQFGMYAIYNTRQW